MVEAELLVRLRLTERAFLCGAQRLRLFQRVQEILSRHIDLAGNAHVRVAPLDGEPITQLTVCRGLVGQALQQLQGGLGLLVAYEEPGDLDGDRAVALRSLGP